MDFCCSTSTVFPNISYVDSILSENASSITYIIVRLVPNESTSPPAKISINFNMVELLI
ncbi:MAG: hypothetical protein ACFE91_07150 [Promethearchaeota archaeon]